MRPQLQAAPVIVMSNMKGPLVYRSLKQFLKVLKLLLPKAESKQKLLPKWLKWDSAYVLFFKTVLIRQLLNVKLQCG